jgi:hypothetical protein
MTKPFKFIPVKVGEPEQYIKFQYEGEEPIQHPIPNLVLPEDQTARFWALHAELQQAGIIPAVQTIYND